MWQNPERFANILIASNDEVLPTGHSDNIKAGILSDPSFGKQETPLNLRSQFCAPRGMLPQNSLQRLRRGTGMALQWNSKSFQCWVPHCALIIILILSHPSLFWGKDYEEGEEFWAMFSAISNSLWVFKLQPEFTHHLFHDMQEKTLFLKELDISVFYSWKKIKFVISVWVFCV